MKRGTMAHLAMMMAIGASNELDSLGKNTWNPNIDTSPKEPPIPKGMKQFQFNSNGELTKYWDNTVFDCYAINLKNAIKKFKKWNSTNSN